MVVYLAAKRDAARSFGVTESSGVRDHGFSTDICQRLESLAGGRAVLCEGLAKLRPKNRLEEADHC